MGDTNPPSRPPSGRRPVAIAGLRRDDPFVRRVAHAWRMLAVGGGRTLVACSGGADSTALLLALALATRDLVVAHVLHDLRPRADAEADRDAVRALAAQLNLPFMHAEIAVADRAGNTESNARRERYAALATMARQAACPFVATAHHADDQLESLLMALSRGAGPHGLRGIAPKRPLTPSPHHPLTPSPHHPLTPSPPHPLTPSPHHPITLLRPMLHATRAEAREACKAAEIAWREDATNLDTSRRRAAVRHSIIPLLASLAPNAARHAAHAAELLRDASRIIDERVQRVFGDASSWPRDILRHESPLILGLGLRRAALRLTAGRHADQLTSRLLRPPIRAIRDDSTDPRHWPWPAGLILAVTAHAVELRRASSA